MKDIKDYLHLYLGCEVMVTPPESASYKCTLTGVNANRTDSEKDKLRLQVFEEDGEEGYEGHGIKWFDEDEVELLLRPLSDAKGDEWNEINAFASYAEVVRYQLSKSFDIFGLIDVGLALDKTKL